MDGSGRGWGGDSGVARVGVGVIYLFYLSIHIAIYGCSRVWGKVGVIGVGTIRNGGNLFIYLCIYIAIYFYSSVFKC